MTGRLRIYILGSRISSRVCVVHAPLHGGDVLSVTDESSNAQVAMHGNSDALMIWFFHMVLVPIKEAQNVSFALAPGVVDGSVSVLWVRGERRGHGKGLGVSQKRVRY